MRISALTEENRARKAQDKEQTSQDAFKPIKNLVLEMGIWNGEIFNRYTSSYVNMQQKLHSLFTLSAKGL